MMSDQTDHSVAASAPYRHEITISVGGDSDDRIQIKTPPSVSTPTPSPRSIQSTTDEISTNSTDDDNAVLAPKQKTSPSGVDNLAFENEHKTSQQRPMSSFGQDGNGTSMKEEPANGKNGMDKPLAEAVNLELVNLNKTPPTNGHRDNGFPQKKKDATQVEISNSYNEYFVPVNEHKKYMRERGLRGVDHYGHSLNEPIEGPVDYNSWRKIARGEKLYVTKDKRLKTNWRKRLLWVIGLALCAAVLIVAILLATGTIGSEPEPIESRQFSSKDKLATAGIFGSGGKGNQNDTSYPPTPQPPGSTVPPHPPTTDENMLYVPNSMNGQFKIENTEFLEEYKDHNSPIYQTISREIESGLMESLQEYKNVHVKVLNLTSGSIVVDYRVTWDDDDDISDDVLMNNLSKYLKENHGYIYSYFVPTETLSFTKVIDSCAMLTDNMNCDNGCEFERNSADFVCSKSDSESNAEPEPESKAEPEPEVSSPEPEPKHSSPEPEPEISSVEPEPEVSSAEPEPASAEPSAKQINEPTSAEPTPDSEPNPEKEPTSKVEPEPATAEPSPKHDDIEHVTSEPISKVEPSPEGEPTSTEPSPEGEPTSAEPSAKEVDIERVTLEPISKSEPSPEGEHVSAEPSPEIVAEHSTAEPTPELDSSKKNNKNGKELSYDEELLSAEKDESAEESTIKSEDHKHVQSVELKEKLESSTPVQDGSTTRRQKYTYDFESKEYANESNEEVETSSEQHEHSSEQSIILPIQSIVEGSTLRTSSEHPAPVTEDLSDDTPMPTEKYFKKAPKFIEQRTEVNVMDGRVTPSSINLTSPTIYSTTSPIRLEHEETSSSTVRLAPYSTSSENPMYSVTENILEQSPFLPENENGETILNILHTPHDDNEDIKAKTLDIEDEESSENDNANFISGPDIIPQKTYKVENASPVEQSETTVLTEFEKSEEETEIPSDSTEIYNVQESRTHNHDNTEATKHVESHSDETLEFSHNTEGGAVPTTIIPFAKNDDEDSTEMEQITKSVNEEEKSTLNDIQESTDKSEQTTLEARSALKNIDAISSDSDASSTEHLENLVSSTSERISTPNAKLVEVSPSAEPSASEHEEKGTTILPFESSSVKIDSTTISVDSKPTEAKIENISSTSEHSVEISPTAEPSSTSSEEGRTELLKDTESESTINTDLVKGEIASTSEKTEVSSSAEPIPSEVTLSGEPAASEATTQTKLSDDELKVIPLQTTKKPDEKTVDDETEKMNEEEKTETTTGHFLSNATFQLKIKTVGTSLNSSEVGNNSTGGDNDNDQIPTSDKPSLINLNESLSTSTEKTGYSRCTAGQFECLNGTSIIDGGACISLSQRCDSIPHCSDSSDEADCEMLGCPGHFQCNDGSCLARSLVCDKILHCRDGSDESESLCNDWKCKFDEISCSENGPCLPAILQCDGISHCSNQADETNCPDTCKNNEFYCSWQHKCIPETFVCDGKIDCSGGEDERLCDCPEDHFKCNTGRCVPNHYVCDGQPQCADLSDDWDCYNLTTVQRTGNGTINPMTDDIETSTEINRALQIKKPNGQFAFVCYDNWNLNYADLICKNLGYARSQEHMAIEINTANAPLVKISDDFRQQHSMLTNLNETDSCYENEVVALECEKYTCGNNLTRDKDAAEKNQTWPSLAVAVNEISSVHCTATIVSPRWALASYSCILGKFELNSEVKSLNWYLQVNGSNFDDENGNSELQQVNVVRIFKYPQTKFKHFLYAGDVVLLELDTPLEFSETVTAACLSDEPINNEEENCISIGWFTSEGEQARENYIKKLDSPPMSTESCNSTANYAGSLPDDLICFDDVNNDDKCQINTDEGAPLLCYSSSKSSWQMKGILSYRNGCRRHALPAVYSGLTPSLLKWITKTIGNDEMVQRR